MASGTATLRAVAVLIFVAAPAAASILHVPSEYSTVQAGLDASVPGDTVLVGPGTYTDYEVRTVAGASVTACAFLVDGVVLRSEGGSAVTTIDMQGVVVFQPSVVFGYLLTSGTTVVEGFTLQGISGTQDLLFLAECDKVTVRDCVFREANGLPAGGIAAGLSEVEVYDSQFLNLTGCLGAGITVTDADFLVDNCSGTVSIDATSLLKEMVEGGMTTYGFILTEDSGGGDGLSSDVIGRLQNLDSATLELRYRKTPPKPRGT